MPSSPLHPPRSPRALKAQSAAGGGRQLRFEPLEPRVVLNGAGLTGQYFHNADFTGLAAERTEAVVHSWGTAAPAPGVHADSFSVRWFGQIEAEYTENYTFRTVNDDGVRLWVDGQLLIDDWAPQATRIETGTIALEAGKRYDIRLEYFDNAGSAQIRLQWSSASQALEDIPAAQLYASPEGLRGEYSDSFGGAGSRIDPTIAFDWDLTRPIAGVAVDSFRARWTGFIRPDFSEEYAFSTTSDEGVRLWIGDELVIDHWSPHATATNTGAKTLEAGKWYDVRIEYFDASGNAEIELGWSSASQTGVGQFETIPAANLRAAKHAPLLFTNPLGSGADPFVVQHDGSYLLVRSSGSSVRIDKADRLEDIHSSDPASTTITAWTAPAGTNYSHEIWAPELHQIEGKWYIYVAASDGNNETHRMYVLERDHPDPFGPYTFKGKIADSTDRWAIDGTVLQWQDKLYFVWSGWPGTVNVQQNLYIAEMSSPWTISSRRVLISSPSAAWERHGLPINEGPEALIHEGRLHIIYSGSGFWRHEYALGRLTYDGTGSLLEAANWGKAPAPVFKQAGNIVGTGHASFTKSPDGTQDWIVYHAHRDPSNSARDILMQPFTYFADGTPNFGTPIPTSVRQEVPSGVPDADRMAVPGDFDANGAVNGPDLGVWSAQFGRELFPGYMVDGADFLAWQRNLGGAAATSAAAIVQDSAPTATLAAADLRGLAGLPLSPVETKVGDIFLPEPTNAGNVDAAFAAWQPMADGLNINSAAMTIREPFSSPPIAHDSEDRPLKLDDNFHWPIAADLSPLTNADER